MKPRASWDRRLVLLNGLLVGALAIQLIMPRHRESIIAHPGARLPPVKVRAVDIAGATTEDERELTADAASSCAVLYFFDPRCPACAKYAPQWKGVERLEIIGRTIPV